MIGSQPAGALACVPGFVLEANVAVCVPVVAELFTISAEFPGSVPAILSGVIPSVPALRVSETPVPPVAGAGIVTSPVVAMFTPYGDFEDVPTVARSAV